VGSSALPGGAPLNPYTNLKIARQFTRLDALRRGEQIVPTQVELVISDLCNHDCWFCHNRLSGMPSNEHFAGSEGQRNPNRTMPTAKALETIECAASMGVRAILFSGGGEPTVHKDHALIFQKALDSGLAAGLITNGEKLTPETLALLRGFSWVRVSLDAGTPETYARVRGISGDRFPRVLDNLRRLRCLGGPYIGVTFLVMRENIMEIEEAARVAKEAGAESIRYSPTRTPAGAGYYGGLYSEATAAIESAKQHQTPGFEVIDQFGKKLGDLAGPPDYSFCATQQFQVYIGADMGLYRCCHLSYNDRGIVGSIKDQTFQEAWESQFKRERIEQFDARNCHFCTFNQWNRTVNDLVHSQVMHPEFL